MFIELTTKSKGRILVNCGKILTVVEIGNYSRIWLDYGCEDGYIDVLEDYDSVCVALPSDED